MAYDPVTYTNGFKTRTWTTTGGALGVIGEVDDYQIINSQGQYGWVPRLPAAPTTTSTPNVPAVTGVNPVETSYSLYGHIIPLLVFGQGRVGGEIISGPWVGDGTASGINSFGVQADPTRVLTLIEVAFDSEVVWQGSQVGDGTLAASGFTTEPFTLRFYTGSLTQSADALETSHFGADAVAYRGQVLLAADNLPLAAMKFKKYPYIACKFVDEDGEAINFGEAFERLAYSPYVGLTSDEFETVGITDGVPDGGFIITDQTDFLSLIQQFGRFYKKWNILQTDKLRIVDRGSDVTPDIVLDSTMLIDVLSISDQEPDSAPAVLELSTIDPEADYTIVPSQATSPREPVAITTSVKTDTAYLPVIMDSATRIAITTYAQIHEDRTRRQFNGTAMISGLEMEPGDLLGITSLNTDFPGSESILVKETLHGANYVVEFVAEAILLCDIEALTTPPPTDADWDNVVLLMGFNGENGSQGAPGFTDESSRGHGTAGVPGTAHIDTSEFKFGTASLRADGNGWSALYGASADWALSRSNSDKFTIECWIKLAEIRAFLNAIVANSFVDIQWYFGISAASELTFGFKPGGGGSTVTVDSTGITLTTGVEYHLAVDKDSSGKIRLYRNGVMIGSATPGNSSFEASDSAGLEIGATGFTAGFTVNGWIDELRITKGIARYASDSGFAVPTRAFPRGET